MRDGIAHARSLSLGAADATIRLGTAARRWYDAADAARSLWDDMAGRSIFQRFLEPHRSVLETSCPLLDAVASSHDAALRQISDAADAAAAAVAQAASAMAAARLARAQAATARAEAGAARSQAGQARSMAGSVMQQIAALGV